VCKAIIFYDSAVGTMSHPPDITDNQQFIMVSRANEKSFL